MFSNLLFKKPSLIGSMVIGKLIGLFIGIIAFFTIPLISPETTLMVRFGFLLWYITFGAVIGIFGIFTYHPILKLPMPWYFRSTVIGVWLNFVISLFAYDHLKTIMISIVPAGGYFSSPFWFTVEGGILGLLIGYFASHFGGEGKEIVKEMK